MVKASNGTASEQQNSVEEFYKDEKNLKTLCNFLRSEDGPAVRDAIMMDKRVHYFKGDKLVNFLMEPKKGTKWPKNIMKFESRQEAIDVCKHLVDMEFILRAEKKGKGDLGMSRVSDFDEGGYFVWLYGGDKKFSNLMTFLLIAGFTCCVCFPIWPNFLKVFTWYMSVTLLLLIFAIITVRGLLFLFIWIIGFDFWLWPNLFDEELNFFDSWKPLYSFQRTKAGQLPYRIGVAVAFFSFCWWAVTQPSEFDGFVTAQGDFIKDLYAGRLLSDMSQKSKEDIDKPKMQSLEDLLKKLDSSDDAPAVVSEEDSIDNLLENLVEEEVTDN